METTKIALENERKIQQLQMQAINALWKKVSNMPTTAVHPANNTAGTESAATNATNASLTATSSTAASDANTANPASQAIVQDLANTCNALSDQVRQLQGSMRDILQCMTAFCQLPQPLQQATGEQSTVRSMVADTQTEIIAVHTPQVDHLPFPFRARGAAAPTATGGPLVETRNDDDDDNAAAAATADAAQTPAAAPVKLQRPSTLPLDGNIGQASEAITLIIGGDTSDEFGEADESAADGDSSGEAGANNVRVAEEASG